VDQKCRRYSCQHRSLCFTHSGAAHPKEYARNQWLRRL